MLDVVGATVAVGVGANVFDAGVEVDDLDEEEGAGGGRAEDGEESFDAFRCCSCNIETELDV